MVDADPMRAYSDREIVSLREIDRSGFLISNDRLEIRRSLIAKGAVEALAWPGRLRLTAAGLVALTQGAINE